jgi:hypothetical protein
MATHCPAVTSVNAAEVNSLTLVDGVTSTVAGPFAPVSVIVVPDTEPTTPNERSLPSAAGAGLDEGEDAAVDGVAEALEAVEDVPDEPQATSEKAARPPRATAAQRDTRDDEIMVPPSVPGLTVRFECDVRSLPSELT